MISHHEVAAIRNYDLRHRIAILVLFGDIILNLRLAVDPDCSVIDTQTVAWQCDNPLDIAFLRIAGIVEDDYIASLNGREAIDKLVDEETVTVLEPRQHAGAFYANRLVEKCDDQYGGCCSNQQIAQPKPKARGLAGRRGVTLPAGAFFNVSDLVCGRFGELAVLSNWFHLL